jgi:hypothetical protein
MPSTLYGMAHDPLDNMKVERRPGSTLRRSYRYLICPLAVGCSLANVERLTVLSAMLRFVTARTAGLGSGPTRVARTEARQPTASGAVVPAITGM